MVPRSSSHKLVLPEGFDDYAWEVEAKGVLWDVYLQYGDRKFQLTFYDPARLAQDVESELEERVTFFEPNLVVVRKVNRAEMNAAVNDLVRTGRVERMRQA
jgi:hypothetical protein